MDIRKTGLFYLGATPVMLRDFPGEMRTSVLKTFDRRFAWILAVCAIVILGLTLMFSLRTPPQTVSDKEILKIQERYAQLVLNQPKPKVKEEKKGNAGEVEKKEDAKKTEAAEEKEPPKKESLEDRQHRREETRQQREAKREIVKRQVQSAGIFAAITATRSSGGTGSASPISDLLSAAGSVGDLGSIDVSKGSFATKNVTAEQLEQRRGERTSGVGIERSSVGTASGGQIASSGEVHISTQPPEMKSESGGAVASKTCIQEAINRESHRIKRVYENWLKRDPTLSGQLKVRFIITATGTVSDVSVVHSTTNSAEFDDNIVRYIKRWDFSTCGTGENIEIVFPFVFSGSS